MARAAMADMLTGGSNSSSGRQQQQQQPAAPQHSSQQPTSQQQQQQQQQQQHVLAAENDLKLQTALVALLEQEELELQAAFDVQFAKQLEALTPRPAQHATSARGNAAL
jgi:hypothetical protein